MPSKWEDNWSLSNWTIPTRPTYLGWVLPLLKGAADERLCFIYFDHLENLADSLKFPEYDEERVILKADWLKIQNSIYPSTGTDQNPNPLIYICSADDFNTGVIADNSETLPRLTYQSLLTHLGYGSTILLSTTDMNQGDDEAVISMDWIKQWFEVMEEQTYYSYRPYPFGSSPLINDFDSMFVTVNAYYQYNPNTSTFTGAEVLISVNGGPAVDVYTPGDLNEVAPFSTPAQVRSYVVSKLDIELADNTNWGFGVNDLEPGVRDHKETLQYSPTNVRIDTDFIVARIRYKTNQAYRPASPDRYDFEIWDYGVSNDLPTPSGLPVKQYDDYNLGVLKDEVFLSQNTKDLNDWHYSPVDPLLTMDLNNPPLLTIPGGSGTLEQRFVNCYHSLVENERRTGKINKILVKPNLDTGLAFEYYTP